MRSGGATCLSAAASAPELTACGDWDSCSPAALRPDPNTKGSDRPRFVIERAIPEIGPVDREALRAASQKSNGVLLAMQAENKFIQWDHSYVAANKTFCIYHASDESLIHEHSDRSGFPASVVTPVKRIIDPATAQ